MPHGKVNSLLRSFLVKWAALLTDGEGHDGEILASEGRKLHRETVKRL